MIEKSQTYLNSLSFPQKLKAKWNARYLQNVRFVILLILAILAVGITALSILPRRLNPEIKLTIVTVSTILPGAAPSDIEKLVTIPLEDKLNGLEGLDTISSTSQENASVIVLQFLSSVDKDKARNDVDRAISEVSTLPSDAQTPRVVALDFENQPIWTFSIVSGKDDASLMRFTDALKEKIKQAGGVDTVTLSGFDNQEIQVVLNPQKIVEYNLNPLAVSQAIKNATQAFPAGSVYTSSSVFTLSLDAGATTVDGIRNIQLMVNGEPTKLGDIAEIYEKSTRSFQQNFVASKNLGIRKGVVFAVYKTGNADIDKTVKNVERVVNAAIKERNEDYSVVTITNAGELISKQFTDLIGEFESTLILVFINLFLFLGLRQALIASITIPLTFLTSFIWMTLLGQSINFISLFALLLAFGTSIDDTIVTVSAMTAYYRTGKFTPIETGLLVWRDIITPIWTTTITTVWAFLPLLLSTGIIGEFIKPIPVVVATTMYTSTFVAWFITLPLIIIFLKPFIPKRLKIFALVLAVVISLIVLISFSPGNGFMFLIIITYLLLLLITFILRKKLGKRINKIFLKNKKSLQIADKLRNYLKNGIISTNRLEYAYKKTIIRILSSKRGIRIAFICIFTFAISSYLLIPLGLVKNEFFPKADANILYVTVEFPTGTNLTTIENKSIFLLSDLKNTPYSEAVILETQSGVGANGAPAQSQNSSLFTITLIPKEKRNVSSIDIATAIRKKMENYYYGKVSVIEQSGGPPAGADVQIKLSGSDLIDLDNYAEKTKSFLSKTPGVANVDKSIKSGTGKLIFIPDSAKLAVNGITLDTLGFWLRTAASGFKLDTVKFTDKETDVVFYAFPQLLTPETITSIQFPSQNGFIPLSALGQFEIRNNPTSITREEGRRTISVSASVLPGYSVSDINKKLEKFTDSDLNLSDGYEWKTGGVNEENQKSVASIFRAMALSFILIMATMVIEFRSYRQAAVILSLIPFAISGVFIIFGLTGTPLSFPALIGVLALFGVVVTNAMFIVDKINQNRKSGMNLIDAISDAGQSRLEPIILTSLTSILGLIPITIATPLWRGLGGAIISGLMFSGIIMLFYIPIMYYTIFRNEKLSV